MTDALVSLPPHLRRRLEGALDTGLISTSSTPATVRSVLGLRDGAENLLADLNALERTGVTGRAAAAWLRAVEQARARSPTPDLVWSGPEVPGLHARDTRRVYEELLGSAERTVWASTYAYFDGPRAFATLAGRMDAIPELQVTLLLNIQRKRGDTTAADEDSTLDDRWPGEARPRVYQLVRRFADRFWTTDAAPRLLRPPIARSRRPCGSAPRQGGGRGRRGGLHDLGEPHRCRLRSQHRARRADPRPGTGRERDEPLSGIDRQGSAEAVTGGMTVLCSANPKEAIRDAHVQSRVT